MRSSEWGVGSLAAVVRRASRLKGSLSDGGAKRQRLIGWRLVRCVPRVGSFVTKTGVE
jgi:hypothetical protein